MIKNRPRHYNILLIIILIYSACNILYSQDNPIIKQWKYDLQILLGFSDDKVDGILGMETFNALKKFAYNHDLADVVLRGEFEDIEGWGFEQYLIKYHAYWIRELKNKRIFNDVHNKEYLRQADETLYTFEISIQNAKLEVERLTQAKLREERLAKEKQERQKWEIEKIEAERLTAELRKSIIAAELESEKWALERIRAQRLAEEKEQLIRLEERKLEADILISDFEDVISVASREIDRLIEENNKIKTFITTSKDTKLLAEELKTELKVARMQMDSLSIQKDSLEQNLLDIQSKMDVKALNTKKNALFIVNDKLELNGSRPGHAETITTVSRGYYQFEANISSPDGGGLMFRTGITSNIEGRLSLHDLFAESSNTIGSMATGFLMHIREDRGLLPGMGIALSISVPNTNGFQMSSIQIELAIPFSKGLAEKLGLDWHLALSHADDSQSASFASVLKYSIIDNLGIFIGFYDDSSVDKLLDMGIYMDGGLTYLFKDHIQLDLNGSIPITKNQQDSFIGIGLVYRLPN